MIIIKKRIDGREDFGSGWIKQCLMRGLHDNKMVKKLKKRGLVKREEMATLMILVLSSFIQSPFVNKMESVDYYVVEGESKEWKENKQLFSCCWSTDWL